MFTAKRGLMFIRCKTCQLLRFSSIDTNYEGLTLNLKFSNQDQQKILDILNKSNTDQLSRFDVSQGRIRSLDSWRNKKGPFKSLADVLEVDGLGVKVLERLCESIVTNDKQTVVNIKVSNNSKNRRQFLMPQLSNEQTSILSSAVGLHLGPAGISWTKLCRYGNQLDSWGFYDISSFPKKMLPTDTFQLAMTILSKIPTGEVYIFESSPNISPQSSQQATTLTTYNQQMELTSMLLALINTSPKHSAFQPDDVEHYTNSVHHLRANLSARLFRTLMGSERVSSTTIITNLLENARNNTKCTLPCTPIRMEEHMQEQYYSQTPVFRELLGQALLVIITFMDLCVYKNPASLAAVTPGKRAC